MISWIKAGVLRALMENDALRRAADELNAKAAEAEASRRPIAPVMQCPGCTLLGAEDRGPIVAPRADGTRTEIGRAYACPHCTAAWFVLDGVARRFGYHKAALSAHPANFQPPPQAPPALTPEQAEAVARSDRDMPWSRASQGRR